MKHDLISLSTLDEFSSDTTGQDVLRYICLPEFLGMEKENLLYFIGKRLARNLDIKTLDDIFLVFNKLHWGKLELIKDKRNKMDFHMMADAIAQRIESSINIEFLLEAGFLAEAIGIITNRPCEVTETINEKLYRVDFKLNFLD